MRLSALGAGVFFCVCIFSLQSEKASAQSVAVATLERNNQTADKLAVLEMVQEQAKPEPVASPEPKKHKITSGETLTQIAKIHETTWQRIYAKNLNIENPDIVSAGTELIIPLADEQLTDRPVPVPPTPEPVAAAPRAKAASNTKPQATVRRGSVAGNTYGAGYCTWYVKNKRPDMPNNLGDAATWVSRAAAQGMATGSTPQVGAVGQRGNHVVYVEAVNGDGTVTISEMNYRALYDITTRTVAANYFQYIY